MNEAVTSDLPITEFENFAKELALKAGKLAKQFSREEMLVRMKGPIDLVTEADLRSEELIISSISERYPKHDFLSEENGAHISDSSFLWIVDPLDGTTNFAHGFPIFSVSIALEYLGEIVLGVVYEPNYDELFTATKGAGSTLNGKKIHVSETGNLDSSLLATGFPYFTREEPKKILPLFDIFSLQCQGVRRAGAASIDLCFLAAGRLDGYWEIGLKPWDTAAGWLIVKEAGGQVTNFQGGDFDIRVPEVVASNGLIHGEMMEIVSAVAFARREL